MTTLEKLNIDNNQYEEMIFSLYARWCESVTINNTQFQIILANAMVNKWFLIELKKCEAEFKFLTDRYINSPTVTYTDFLNCYKNTTYRLFSIRPTALLEILKQSNSLSLLSHGIPVFTSLNSN